MSPIVPAIIPKSSEHLKDSFELIAPFAREAQVDVVDGIFVPFTSWPYTGGSVADLNTFTNAFLVEIDFMIMKPEEVMGAYLSAGVRRIVVHLESTNDLDAVLLHKKTHDFRLGFSIDNDTPLRTLTEVIEKADYVQLMGITHIGSQGQPFDERVLERVAFLRERYPELLISIDGSVNDKTVSRLAHAGADRCVTGSAIFGEKDPHIAFDVLTSLYTISA